MKRLPPMKVGPVGRIYMRLAEWVDHTIGWQNLLPLVGALNLGGVRMKLRQRNLYDTDAEPATKLAEPVARADAHRSARTADGTFNDLDFPAMGSAGARFGRNVPLDLTYPGEADLMHPNPRRVSLELLSRDEFIPARSLNLLAAAWLQFMVHDWMQHGRNRSDHPFEVKLTPDDPWPQPPMTIPRTRRDPTAPEHPTGQPPTFANVVTAWWDGSQIYGSDEKTQTRVRAGVDGKLRIEGNGLLPLDEHTRQDVTGVTGNYWVGLGIFHTLFTQEHNAICDALKQEYPGWSDDELFDHARLVNVALMAKIHTVEWTPGILGHPTLRIAMNANWWGLAGERIWKRFGRISRSDWISGIPGSETQHFGVPYSLTEEFVAVYRMHPLIPDDYSFRAHTDNSLLRELTFPDLTFHKARPVMETIPMADLLYSFGTMNPGAITLHNFPRGMQLFTKANGQILDLAALDILRSRERGVPRYNEFRRLLHKRPVRSFEEMTGNPDWARQLREVYEGDVELVDTTVGLFAEPLPKGFGFSDTAFRIFILMASRRLNSDRFFTVDFRPEVYSPRGLRWVQDNGFADVVLRHHPDLAPAVRALPNPFAPWKPAGG